MCVEPGSDGLGIRIEVTWMTPGDPDPTNEGTEAGADMDLHFTHPNATSDDGLGWFDQVFDCFWFNPNPNWGDLDPTVDDDPVMLKDDTDGAGPEIIELEHPQDGMSYRVAVHYWHDHGYGMSMPMVQIWIDGVLAQSTPANLGPSMEHLDLWEVATIEWPSGEVTPLTTDSGGFVIISDYESPFF